MTGAERIAKERQRQIDGEGYTPEHDDEHDDGSLALAAACYATPVKLYRFEDQYVQILKFHDPWPWPHDYSDQRFGKGEKRGLGSNILPDPATYTDADRIDLLTKAGALIAAEIDRLQRQLCGGCLGVGEVGHIEPNPATGKAESYVSPCPKCSPAGGAVQGDGGDEGDA